MRGCQNIETHAFFGCRSLLIINFPSTVSEIGGDAFSECSNLRELVLNEGFQKIGERVFDD